MLKLGAITKIKWEKTVTRPIFLYSQISQTEGERDYLRQKIGAGFTNKILLPAESGHMQYFAKEEWLKFATSIKQKLRKNKNWLMEYANESYSLGSSFEKFLAQIFSMPLASKSNRALSQYYQELKKYRRFSTYLLYPYLTLEGILEENLKKELTKEMRKTRGQKSFRKIFNTLTSKTLNNESDEEEKALLKIAKEYVERGKKWNKKLEKALTIHARKYS